MRRIVPLIIVLAVVIYGGYRIWVQKVAAASTTLTGSGTIEATDVEVADDNTGRITAVLVDEGDTVKAGQPLVRLDDSILQAQLAQATAALAAAKANRAAAQATQAAAQANLDELKAGNRPQDITTEQQTVVADEGRVTQAAGQCAQSRGQLQAAEAARDQAIDAYAYLKQGARPEQIEDAAVASQQAEAAVRVAQANYDKISMMPNVAQMPEALALQQATMAYNAAKANYNGVLVGATTPQLDQARAAIDQAQAGIISASAGVSETDAALTTAQASLAAEQSHLDEMVAGTRPEQIRAGEAQLAAAQAQTQAAAGQVAAAQASVDLIKTEIAQLVIVAPSDGVVLTRAAEPGDVALPGGTLLELADLAHLTLTVYVPEDRFGEVHVGEQAHITVDSFPGRVFAGSVQQVANQAEFTPRNVSTPSGRTTTVFGVKLDLDNPKGELKAGMPADVVFGQ